MNTLGISQRRVGNVTILDADRLLVVSLKFGVGGGSLEKTIESLLTSGQRHILLNVEGITTISAKGLGQLVSVFARVARSGGEFKLFNVTPSAHQLIVATKLAGIFGCYQSEREAVASIGRTERMPESSADLNIRPAARNQP